MLKKSLLTLAGFVLTWIVQAADSTANQTEGKLQTMVSAAAVELANQPSIPAAGVTVVRCRERASAAAGVPQMGASRPLAETPFFNIGSNAKSMLATVAAHLATEGIASFDITLLESGAFPDIKPDHPFATISLRELFSHTSGIATFHTGTALDEVQTRGKPAEQRRQFAEWALASAPAGSRGEAAYSNAGIAVAGVVLEHLTGTDTLTLLATQLFKPLGLNAIVGDTGDGNNGQPVGHYWGEDGTLAPYLEKEPAIPPFLQSAGYVSISAEDYGRYLQMHLCGMQGENSSFLSAEAIRELHNPVSGSPYALGWAKMEFAGEEASFHVGGTGTFLALAVILPKADKAIGIMINSAAPEGRTANIKMLHRLAGSTDTQD